MELIRTKNINKLFELMGNVEMSMEAMQNAMSDGKANMGLIYGDSGWGKTVALKLYQSLKSDKVIYIRARRSWTASWMIEDIARALGLSVSGRTRDRFMRVVDYLSQSPKILIIDEMNHFVDDAKIMETLRDIHDICENNPIIIAGSEGIEKRIKRYTSLCDRLRVVIDFNFIDGSDVEQFTKKYKTQFSKGVCDAISKDSKGKSMRAMMRMLDELDNKARANKIKELDEATYRRLK